MIKCARHPYCDREFEEKSGGRKQIYCSHRCGNLAWHQRAKLTKPVDWPPRYVYPKRFYTVNPKARGW